MHFAHSAVQACDPPEHGACSGPCTCAQAPAAPSAQPLKKVLLAAAGAAGAWPIYVGKPGEAGAAAE